MEVNITRYEAQRKNVINYLNPKNEKEYESLFNKLNNKININDLNIIKYIFKEKDLIHDYLYNKEIIIDLIFDNKHINFSSLFYLNLLIESNSIFINYSYQLDAIVQVNNLHNIYKNNNIIRIIIAKNLIVLINNYRGFELYDEYTDEKIIKPIEKKNNEFISENIKYFNEININWNDNYINKKKIDEIYIEIIIFALKNNNEDYEYMYKLLKHLDLELIDLTEIMITKLLNYFNEQNKDLLIDKNNLFNKKIINYLYLIFKFILKDSVDIFQFPFLLKIRDILIDLIEKDKSKKIFSDLNKDFKMKYKYVFKYLFKNKYNENDLDSIFDNQKRINIISTKIPKEIKTLKIPMEILKPKEKKNKTENNTFNDKNKTKIKVWGKTIIKIDEKKLKKIIKNKIFKYPYYNSWKIKEDIYQTTCYYPYKYIKLKFIVHYNIRTKEIIKIIDGNE